MHRAPHIQRPIFTSANNEISVLAEECTYLARLVLVAFVLAQQVVTIVQSNTGIVGTDKHPFAIPFQELDPRDLLPSCILSSFGPDFDLGDVLQFIVLRSVKLALPFECTHHDPLSIWAVGHSGDHFVHIHPIRDVVIRDVPDPQLLVQGAADEELVVHRVETDGGDEIVVGEHTQALVHADVPESHGFVHGCREQELRIRPRKVQHVRLVSCEQAARFRLEHGVAFGARFVAGPPAVHGAFCFGFRFRFRFRAFFFGDLPALFHFPHAYDSVLSCAGQVLSVQAELKRPNGTSMCHEFLRELDVQEVFVQLVFEVWTHVGGQRRVSRRRWRRLGLVFHSLVGHVRFSVFFVRFIRSSSSSKPSKRVFDRAS
mmetsp:Transcript_6168/g.38295  ORF Transcript_6168/g.38295 Transcript_6168/m.38295 type:complete len:372 (+) Transcript_6168:954-2069(+)